MRLGVELYGTISETLTGEARTFDFTLTDAAIDSLARTARAIGRPPARSVPALVRTRKFQVGGALTWKLAATLQAKLDPGHPAFASRPIMGGCRKPIRTYMIAARVGRSIGKYRHVG